MNFLNSYSSSENNWQVYRQLELISDAVVETDRVSAPFNFGLGWVWRKFIELLIAELIAEDRITEYLDRCWLISDAESEAPSIHKSFLRSFHRLWMLMD